MEIQKKLCSKICSLNKYLLYCILFIFSSCFERQFIEGRVELVSILDSNLNDSSIIYGHINLVDWPDDYNYNDNEFEIWIEGSDLKATNDLKGFYSLKIQPGTYTIKGQQTSNRWDKLIEKIKDVEIMKNKKIEIDFYIGYTVE